MEDPELAANYSSLASSLIQTYNAAFWDEDQGMYRVNATTASIPQDANVWAVVFGLTEIDGVEGRKERVSEGLKRFWGEFGSVSTDLECPDAVSPFIGGFEVSFGWHVR